MKGYKFSKTTNQLFGKLCNDPGYENRNVTSTPYINT